MSIVSDDLIRELEDRDYRHAYADDFLNAFIASQLKALREQRGWTQTELADRAGMKQSRISTMENVNYSGWSVRTLARLAEAFDTTLVVEFKSFGDRLRDFARFSPERLKVPGFNDDPFFHHESVAASLPPSAFAQQVAGLEHQATTLDDFRLSDALHSLLITTPEMTTPWPGLWLPLLSSRVGASRQGQDAVRAPLRAAKAA